MFLSSTRLLDKKQLAWATIKYVMYRKKLTRQQKLGEIYKYSPSLNFFFVVIKNKNGNSFKKCERQIKDILIILFLRFMNSQFKNDLMIRIIQLKKRFNYNTLYTKMRIDQNLFTVLERGDRKIDLLKEKVIMLVGLTRVGKSCTFNWVLKHPMIGEGDQIEASYKTINQDPSTAALGSEYWTVTLIPNSAEIDSETSLVDMAGFGDTRNYVGEMGVSYFLKSVFKKGKEFKFLIVFNQHAFFEPTGASIIKTFQYFLNMFKIELLDQTIKRQLFDSISLVINRSRMPQNHSVYLRGVINRINNPQLKTPNKELMTELVKSMIQFNRLHAFQMAKYDQNPGQCNLFQHFEPMNWKFLKIHDIQEKIGQSIITLPFETEFNFLPYQQKILFTDSIQEHTEIYSGFASILKELLNSLKDNWNKLVINKSVADLPDNFMDGVLCFKNVFQFIKNFLDSSDKYHSEELITLEIRAQYPRSNLVQSIRTVLKIYAIVDLIGNQQQANQKDMKNCPFSQNMKRYSELFSELTDCIKSLCTSALQQRMVLRLNFILARSFRQFSQLYSITPENIAHINQKIKDRCNNYYIFNQSSNEYVSNFILPMTSELITRIFTTIPEIDEYEKLFYDYKQKYSYIQDEDSRNKKEKQFYKHKITINIVKSDIYLRQKEWVRAGISFLGVIRLLQAQKILIDHQDLSQDNEAQRSELYLSLLRAVQKLVKILIVLDIKEYPNAKDLAISLCKEANEIDAGFQAYELQLLDYSNDKQKLCVIYQNYADYCISLGRFNQADKILQKKLELQVDNIEERSQTLHCLYDLAEDRSRLLLQDNKSNTIRMQNSNDVWDSQLMKVIEDIEFLLKSPK